VLGDARRRRHHGLDRWSAGSLGGIVVVGFAAHTLLWLASAGIVFFGSPVSSARFDRGDGPIRQGGGPNKIF